MAQHRVLVLLDERGALSVNDLADSLGVDQSNASRHCSRLARLGLVTRSRAAHDGRAVMVGLTPAGLNTSIQPFIEFTGDFDLGSGSDSVQTWFGLDFHFK